MRDSDIACSAIAAIVLGFKFAHNLWIAALVLLVLTLLVIAIVLELAGVQ